MSGTVLHVGGASPYDVVVGRGLADRLPGLLGPSVQRVAVLFSERQAELAQPLVEGLVEHHDVLALGLPDGEAAKTASVANDCWEALGERGFTRSDAVVTFGGGAVTDLGGFVAASWLRGVAVVHVPTTLLGMVDAAVGGKTGINTAAGKNLVGAFHEPLGVLCDLATLDTLPRADLVAGLAEVVKCGFIADPRILELVEEHDPASLTPDSPVLRELVERAIRVKVDVVVGDLRETGASGGVGRELLNYGHTLAHAVEKAEGYTVRHGDAVAIGCVYAAELAGLAGLLDAATVDRHREVLQRVGLPTTYANAGFEELLASMRVDKKARGSQIRFVALEGLGRAVVLEPTDEQLRDAWERIGGGAA
jgi:3-dehydroquinate synthase